MTDMSDKFSCIIQDKDGITIDAINDVGATFNEVSEMAKKMEEKTGNTYVIIKDKYLFDAIYLLTGKYTDILSEMIELRDTFDDTVHKFIMGEK